MNMNILALGDVVGPGAVEYLRRNLREICRRENIDFVVANGENAAAGNGLDIDSAETLLDAGVDVLTSGNHIWQKREIYTYLDDYPTVIRPANYRASNPGSGWTVIDNGQTRILVINVMGTVYMEPLDNPFTCVEKILEKQRGTYDLAILDIHAEATSEKLALAFHFDGRIPIIFGTHTHVPTADEQILPRGSGYITDLGMCGPIHSVLGVKPGIIIEKMTAHMPARFELAETRIEANGAIFTCDPASGRISGVRRIRF